MKSDHSILLKSTSKLKLISGSIGIINWVSFALFLTYVLSAIGEKQVPFPDFIIPIFFYFLISGFLAFVGLGFILRGMEFRPNVKDLLFKAWVHILYLLIYLVAMFWFIAKVRWL